MPWLAELSIVGVVVLAVLIFVFMKVRQKDLLGALVEKRRNTSRLVGRADYVEGAQLIPVAMAVTSDALYYENMDLEASFDLNRIDEVEYSDDLMTGKNHRQDTRVLRLRSHGQTFEFLLEKADTPKWEAVLPPRTLGAVTAHAS